VIGTKADVSSPAYGRSEGNSIKRETMSEENNNTEMFAQGRRSVDSADGTADDFIAERQLIYLTLVSI
jgi:hypothetical protein